MLESLLQGITATVVGPTARPIRGLTLSSTQVQPDSLWVAIQGTQHDGHRFAADAVARGAAAVLVSQPVAIPPTVTRIQVPDTREALTHIAGRFFGDPSMDLTLIGITGTNGKTTCSYLLEAILQQAGLNPGVVGTVNYRFGGRLSPAPNTTPDLVAFQALLQAMRAAGVEAAVAEISSHALTQRRIDGLHFDVALFTNLSRDHLDYHGSLESYFDAKARLLDEVLGASRKEDTLAVVNLDDPRGLAMKGRSQATRTWGFSTEGIPGAEVRVRSARLDLDGIQGELDTPAGRVVVASRLLGAHNLENILAAVAVAVGLGLSPEVIRDGIGSVIRIPGRAEEVPNDRRIKVLVDYAHTDDALRHVLKSLRTLAPGRLITVFGCGGERDPGKRPLMAEAASSFSDLAVLTADNPRGEAAEAIIEDMLPGLVKGIRLRTADQPLMLGTRQYQVEVDRRQAIRLGIQAAEPGDVVLIAGKGHEDYQLIEGEKRHFDDREEAVAALQQLGG